VYQNNVKWFKHETTLDEIHVLLSIIIKKLYLACNSCNYFPFVEYPTLCIVSVCTLLKLH